LSHPCAYRRASGEEKEKRKKKIKKGKERKDKLSIFKKKL
jgi:hypothetical protein